MSTKFATCAQKSGDHTSTVGTHRRNKNYYFSSISVILLGITFNNHVANCNFLDSCLGFNLRLKPTVKVLFKWGEIGNDLVVLNFGTVTSVVWSLDWNFPFFRRQCKEPVRSLLSNSECGLNAFPYDFELLYNFLANLLGINLPVYKVDVFAIANHVVISNWCSHVADWLP